MVTLRRILHRIALIQVSLLLFLAYILVVTPLGFLTQLNLKKKSDSTWEDFTEKYKTLEHLR